MGKWEVSFVDVWRNEIFMKFFKQIIMLGVEDNMLFLIFEKLLKVTWCVFFACESYIDLSYIFKKKYYYVCGLDTIKKDFTLLFW